MKEILIMSYRETERLKVISRIEFKELTVADAAECLHISERQMYRILKRYHAEGEAGLLHRLRGRPSLRATHHPAISIGLLQFHIGRPKTFFKNRPINLIG